MKIVHEILKEVCRNLDFYGIKELSEDRYKRFAELSIMFGYVRSYAEENCAEEDRKIKEFLVSQMTSISSDRIFKNFYISYHLILPYVSIREFQKIPHLEHCLEIIAEDKMLSSEIPPHRQMEWEHMIGKMSNTTTFKVPQNSILNKIIHSQFLSRELTYSITHALFYITDFGTFSPNLTKERCNELVFILGSLIAKTSQEKDIDLMLELVINYLSLSDLKSVDLSILSLVYRALNQTSFIQFHLDEAQTIKKYHTLFVLSILCLRLEKLLKSDIPISAYQRSILDSILNEKEYKRQLMNNSPNKFEDSWKILDSLQQKNFNFNSVYEYFDQWGYCPQLSKEVLRYIDFLQERAKRGVIWEEESSHLGLHKEHQEQLDRQLIDLLSKEKKKLRKYNSLLDQIAV